MFQDIIVSDLNDVQSLLMVNGLFGSEISTTGAGLYFHNDQFSLVQRYDINLLMPFAIVAVKDNKSMIFQIPGSHLLAQYTKIFRLLPALYRAFFSAGIVKLQQGHSYKRLSTTCQSAICHRAAR